MLNIYDRKYVLSCLKCLYDPVSFRYLIFCCRSVAAAMISLEGFSDTIMPKTDLKDKIASCFSLIVRTEIDPHGGTNAAENVEDGAAVDIDPAVTVDKRSVV